jgi:5-methylcytosine-specific restriction endonuclease McrA
MSVPRPCLRCGRPSWTSTCASCAPQTTAGRGYGRDWQLLRLEILDRDEHRCGWCGARATTVDHIVPLARGGARLDPANLIASCGRCNYGRTSNLLP